MTPCIWGIHPPFSSSHIADVLHEGSSHRLSRKQEQEDRLGSLPRASQGGRNRAGGGAEDNARVVQRVNRRRSGPLPLLQKGKHDHRRRDSKEGLGQFVKISVGCFKRELIDLLQGRRVDSFGSGFFFSQIGGLNSPRADSRLRHPDPKSIKSIERPGFFP